jgi:hypothetical protein
MLKRILQEPLLHFLIIGAMLFAGYAVVNPGAIQSDKRIVVDQGEINSLVQRFKRVWQREPNEQELHGLIEDFVIEEIYYREALAMGIDKNDPVIRRRLRQKMELYTDNLATTLAPGEAELTNYLQQHPEKFTTDSRYSFAQVYINADVSTKQLDDKISHVRSALLAGQPVKGDPSLLAESFENADGFSIDRMFGSGFSKKLDHQPLGSWSGPVRSGIGVHFVKITRRQPGQLPALAEVRDEVEREWRFDKAQSIDKALREQLLASYEIVIANETTVR